ncbi:MAG: hypothetical protein FWD40_01760 [Treponema sp.]|nr:hypothetical protein [Treponema sp.]
MKNTIKLFRIGGMDAAVINVLKLAGMLILIMAIGFSMVACDDDDGTCTHSFSKVITPGYETDTCTKCGETGKKTLTLEVGDTGPAGGIIYYVNTTGFIVTFDNSRAHYLEAAPADSKFLGVAWSFDMEKNIAGTAGNFGRGRQNTALITAADDFATAAAVCIDYGVDTDFNDWFLPSTGELMEMYSVRATVSGLPTTGHYWTSVQQSVNQAILIDFGGVSGSGQIAAKWYLSGNVRPVRAF